MPLGFIHFILFLFVDSEIIRIFAARNPPRVENTEARPPQKRRAYFFTD
jgi:hypothetical protein